MKAQAPADLAEVKSCRARLIHGWVTNWNYRVAPFSSWLLRFSPLRGKTWRSTNAESLILHVHQEPYILCQTSYFCYNKN